MNDEIIKFGPVDVAPGERRTLTEPVPRTKTGGFFRPRSLAVDPTTAKHFILRDIRVDNHTQLADPNAALPAALFAPEAVGQLVMENGQIDMTLVIERRPLPPPPELRWWGKVLIALRLRERPLPPAEPEKVTFTGMVMATCYEEGEPARSSYAKSVVDGAYDRVMYALWDAEEALSPQDYDALLKKLEERLQAERARKR